MRVKDKFGRWVSKEVPDDPAYSNLFIPTINAVQDLKKIIEERKQAIKELRNESTVIH